MNADSPDDPEYQPYAPGHIEQSVAGSGDILWMLVDEVEAAFKAEAGALSTTVMLDRAEVTNATLRTAWPFALKALRERRDG